MWFVSSLHIVAKRYIIQQKFLKKLVESCLLGTQLLTLHKECWTVLWGCSGKVWLETELSFLCCCAVGLQ